MKTSRSVRLTVFFFVTATVVGLAATIYGLVEVSSALDRPRATAIVAGLLIALSTCANLLARFVRWQYLLRRLGVRRPTLPSLGGFAGSFAFLPIPLYFGQLAARARLGIPAGGERTVALFAFLLERALDALILSFLALPVLPLVLRVMVFVALVGLMVPVGRHLWLRGLATITGYLAQLILWEPPPLPADAAKRAGSNTVASVAAALSLLAWFIPCLALLPLAWASGISIGTLDGMGAAAASILAGAFSLVPLGAGTSGFALFHQLEQLRAPAGAAALVVLVYRAATLWLTVGLGAIALLVHHFRYRQPQASDHFDHIDDCYDAWLPPHIRTHVVHKKVAAMLAQLEQGDAVLRGLDIGCGRGWYLRELELTGTRMVGIDLSACQIAASRQYLGDGATLAQATVSAMPFAPASFDFAYIINVLHHLPTLADQVQALAEIAAVVRPGGLVFVHEMNMVNPLFRFYMSYLFPILKGIEEGTEPYMDSRELPQLPELALDSIEYFTFTPDFVPAKLLAFAVPLERRLERSPMQRYAAHFMAVFRRTSIAATFRAGEARIERS